MSLFTHPQKLSAFPYEVASAKPNLVGLSRTVVKAVFESQIHVLTYPWQAPFNRDASIHGDMTYARVCSLQRCRTGHEL